MGDLTSLPAWKRNKATAGAMMLIKGYVQPVTICDRCQRALERADGIIDVRFEGLVAMFACPHCGCPNQRRLSAQNRLERLRE